MKEKIGACNYFLRTVDNTKIDFNFDVSKFYFERQKRELPDFLNVGILGSILSFLMPGIFPIRDALQGVKRGMNENLNFIQSVNNITYDSVQLQELLLNKSESVTSILNDKLFNLTRLVKNDQLFNNIMNTIIFSILEHRKYQNQLNLVYANQLNDRLFEIIDFRNLSGMIREVNENILGADLFISDLTSIKNNTFIRSFSRINESHLTIFVHFPVLYKNTWTIWNFIPIPFWDKKNLLVMNESRTEFIRNGSMNYHLKNESKNRYCLKRENQMICNSFVRDGLTEISECISGSLVKKSDSYCLYNQTIPGNYFYEISDVLVYAFIVKPIEISIQCPNGENVIQLIRSQYFGIESDCIIFKKSNLHLNRTKLMTIDILVNSLRPNISIGVGNEPPQREKIAIFKEHGQAFDKIYNDLSNLNDNITFQRNRINQITEADTSFFGDIWHSIKFFFSNVISRYVFTFLGILLGIYLCLIFSKLICRKFCSAK